MTGKNPEPKRPRDGKAFHRKVHADWKGDAEAVRTEMTVKKDGGGSGRLDVVHEADPTMLFQTRPRKRAGSGAGSRSSFAESRPGVRP